MNNPWPWLAAALMLLLALAFAALWWRERSRMTEAELGPDDRFAAVAALSPAEMELLDYLVRAFPGRPVLFRCALSRMVTVRRTSRRFAAQQRLAEHSVDYVVCDRSGRPVYAFELDAVHADPEEAEQDAAEKHRVLKTAGIRLIRLKRSTRDLPPSHEFRAHLRAAALPPPETTATADDPWGGAERKSARPAPAPLPAASAAPAAPVAREPVLETQDQDTRAMSFTDLMGLPPAEGEEGNDDPWGSGRS